MNIFFKYTLNVLKKNRTRTLVTILGIILSVSMITAVSLGVTSFHSYFHRLTISQKGNWYGMIPDVTNGVLKEIKSDQRATNVFYCQSLGYGVLKGCKNEDKPYLYVLSVSDGFAGNMPVRLTSGRLPKKKGEIILPIHLWTNGRVKHAIGDSLQLEIGHRESEGYTLWQDHGFIKEGEKLVGCQRQKYQVVGFYERPSFEPFSAPGYTALTVMGDQRISNCSVYFKTKKINHIMEVINKSGGIKNYRINGDLIPLEKMDFQHDANVVIYGLAGVLLVLIMIGSISLIYNAFSISLGERVQQFGMISSLGATKKQLQTSVFFEALILSGIGVPLGILSGVVGIGVTFYVIQDYFSYLFRGGVNMKLAVEPVSILLAMGLGAITVFISAWIPAKRVLKLSPIEAIRQSDQLQGWKKIRVFPFVYSLFGLEGMIAAKNFKRSKRKYRIIVFSLFVSILLFITTSSFTDYIQKIVVKSVSNRTYDLSYYFQPEDNEYRDYKEAYRLLKNVEGVEESTYHCEMAMHITVDQREVTKEYKQFWEKHFDYDEEKTNGEISVQVSCHFVEDEFYEKFLEKHHFDKKVYGDSKNPTALVNSQVMIQDNGNQYVLSALKKNQVNFVLDQTLYKGKTYKGRDTKAEILGIETNTPFMVVMYPLSAMGAVLGERVDKHTSITFYFAVKNNKVYEKMNAVLVEEGYQNKELINKGEQEDYYGAFVSIMRIFSYGFIALISLIVATNVFNTIFTNFNLRRREFAMLKSVGMTDREFLKMMYYECFWYGVKALAYGIPISLVFIYGVYLLTIHNIGMEFSVPWKNVCIAVLCVFIVVFSTVIYSTLKSRKNNIIDELRDLNF